MGCLVESLGFWAVVVHGNGQFGGEFGTEMKNVHRVGLVDIVYVLDSVAGITASARRASFC